MSSRTERFNLPPLRARRAVDLRRNFDEPEGDSSTSCGAQMWGVIAITAVRSAPPALRLVTIAARYCGSSSCPRAEVNGQRLHARSSCAGVVHRSVSRDERAVTMNGCAGTEPVSPIEWRMQRVQLWQQLSRNRRDRCCADD
jgi:hypothetical protein